MPDQNQPVSATNPDRTQQTPTDETATNPPSQAPGPKTKTADGKKVDPKATETYVLKSGVGKHHLVERDKDGTVTDVRQLQPGEETQLTAAQAFAFGDKFTKK